MINDYREDENDAYLEPGTMEGIHGPKNFSRSRLSMQPKYGSASYLLSNKIDSPCNRGSYLGKVSNRRYGNKTMMSSK